MIRYLNLSKIVSYFLSDSNNDRYLNPSYFLTNPLALSKIIGEGFAPCQGSYATSYVKKFSHNVLFNKMLSRSRSLILIM